jgi:hypothetical protein
MTNEHRYLNEHLVLAGMVSLLSIGAVYIAFLTDEKVPNAIVASVTALAVLAMALGWAFYAGRLIRDKFAAVEARIDDIETDQVIERALSSGGYLRRDS